MTLRLAPRADLAVYYQADAARYRRGSDGQQDSDLPQLSRAQFEALYGACPSIGFECDGVPIGGILFDGRRAHIAVLPAYHGRWALLLKPALEWLFSLRSSILVGIEADNRRCLAFMDRNGWMRAGRCGNEILYLMTPQGGRRKAAHVYSGASPRRMHGSLPGTGARAAVA